jgi:hypothetical protein
MAKATEFCIGLHNKPGTLAKLCAALARAKVNIDAVSVSENAECCWVRMVASPPATAKKVLTKARYHFCLQPVLTLPAHNRPGELERVASRLAKAGVNINYVYGSNAKGVPSTLVLSVSDLKRADAVL